MPDTRPIDAALVERARTGDQAALQTLVKRIEPMLRAYFISRIGHRTEVDDLVQNTLLRMHRSLSDLRDVLRLRAFMMKAAVFELQDYYRGRYGSKEQLMSPDVMPMGEAREMYAGARVDVERAMAVLSERARTILEMREYGYRYVEIARALATTEGAVKMQVKRAFKQLCEAFGETRHA